MIKTPLEVLNLIHNYGMIYFKDKYKHAYINKDFRWVEFLINQTDKPTLVILKNIANVAQILRIYKHCIFNGAAITITSGWRSHRYNANMKPPGAKNSLHISGLAADFTVHNVHPNKVYEILNKYHFGGLERTDGNWTHIDLRNTILRFTPNGTVLASTYSVKDHETLFIKLAKNILAEK